MKKELIIHLTTFIFFIITLIKRLENKSLDIYSIPFAGLINDNLENEIKCFIISDLIYNDIIKNMKKGYSFEDCLENEMFYF